MPGGHTDGQAHSIDTQGRDKGARLGVCAWQANVLHPLHVLDLRVSQHVGIAVDGTAGYALGTELRQPMFGVVLRKNSFQQFTQGVLMFGAQGGAGETLVLGQVRAFYNLTDGAPQRIVARCHGEVTAFALERLVGGITGVGGAQLVRVATTAEIL